MQARLLQLSNAEEAISLHEDGPEELRVRASLKQTRSLICAAIQGLHVSNMSPDFSCFLFSA